MPEKDPNIVTLPNVRLSFPALFTAKSMEEGKEPQFSATFLFDNVEHDAVLTRIESVIDRVALDFFKKKVPLKHRCLHDGNEKSDLEGYGDGTSFLVSSNKKRPGVVDRLLNPLAEADGKVYPGCYVNATVRIFAWEHKTGGRGVSAQLRAVQFVKDGPSFGAGPVDPTQEFSSLDDANAEAQQASQRSRSTGRSGASKPSDSVDDY